MALSRLGYAARVLNQMYNYFQTWRIEPLGAELNKQPLPPFYPPKPALEDGLRVLFKVKAENLTTSSFKKSMIKTFFQVGLLKDPN